jgi:hypothetical protein
VTRDKGKWTYAPDDFISSGELLLPSFGIKVARSDPRSEVFLAGTEGYELAPDSGDALSMSYINKKGDANTVDRRFMGLDQAYIRRVLLRVLDGEEYVKIFEHYDARDSTEKVELVRLSGKRIPWFRKVKEPDPKAQVRITDLRLAKDLIPEDLRRKLDTDISGLHLPVTVDGILRWKWKTLRKPKGLLTLSDLIEKPERYEEERVRIMAISFAAAAHCLFVDLGMVSLEKYSRDDLIEHILDLHGVIRGLISEVDESVSRLSGLLAGRKGTTGGRPPDPEFKNYTALVLYRMGRPPYKIARRIGISAPYPSERRKAGTAGENLKSNDNWKSKLKMAIKKGIEIEQEKFPVAAEVFAHRDEKKIQEAALTVYEEWLKRDYWWPEYIMDILEDGDDLLDMPANEQGQITVAMTQLGSCIKNGIDPLSPNLD